jgi:hypothetical protein
MVSLSSLVNFTHLIGLAISVGAATVKLVLLLKCKFNYDLVPAYLKVAKSITQLIILGMILLTLSGIGWLLLGYPFTSELILKLILFAVIWILGPVIDNVVEPKLHKFAPATDQQASPEFVQILKKYLTLEVIATGLFYIILVFWVLIRT